VHIIAQTAYAMKSDIQLSKDAGCNDYLAKPIRSNALLEILDKYLSK